MRYRIRNRFFLRDLLLVVFGAFLASLSSSLQRHRPKEHQQQQADEQRNICLPADGGMQQEVGLTNTSLASKEPVKVNVLDHNNRGFRQMLKKYSKNGQFLIGNGFVSFVDLPRTVQHCPQGTTIFVFVCTAPTYKERRTAIRESWLNQRHQVLLRKHRIFVVFIAGIPEDGALIPAALKILHDESREHGDVILSSWRDSYRTISYKALVGNAWGLEFCPSATYHVKVDDDTFVNIPRMVRYITETMKQPPLPDGKTSFLGKYRRNPDKGYTYSDVVLMGPLFEQGDGPLVAVDRLKTSPWYVSRDLLEADFYPTYAYGMFRACTVAYAKACLDVTMGRELIAVEDALISGVIAEQIGARRIYDYHVKEGAGGNATFATADVLNNLLAEQINNRDGAGNFTVPVAYNTWTGLDAASFKMAAELVLRDVNRVVENQVDGKRKIASFRPQKPRIAGGIEEKRPRPHSKISNSPHIGNGL